MDKAGVMKMGYMQFVLQACVNSCQFGFIEEIQKGRVHFERANINAVIAMPFGSGKTTNLLEVSNGVVANDVSFAGMVGTISREGEFVPGAILNAAGKVLLMDEFNKVDRRVKDCMNNLVEQKSHPRQLGFKVKSRIKRNGKFYKMNIDGGYINIKARFSTICSTMYMKLRESNNTSDIAWMTRFIPIRFLPGLDYYEALGRGERLMDIEVNPVHIERFTFTKYLEANKYFWDAFKESQHYKFFLEHEFYRGVILRIFKDIERLAAYLSSLDGKTDIDMEDFKFCMKFLPMIMTNFIYWDLTEHEQKIIENHESFNEEELAMLLKISQPAVSNIISGLKKKGLIKEV